MKNYNHSKRQKVMARSIKLGHCICDPSRPCPCDIFTGQGLCPCAGERPDPTPAKEVKLTELVHNGGCASKIPASDLERFLSRLPMSKDPAVISGLPQGDDAGIYQITEELSLVQTLDVFTPCVDDPFLFGKICAANCLSDIYAMGGDAKTALSVLGFPVERLDGDIMYRMMAGAVEVLEEAGCALIGGHSIKDEEIKLGFAVTGTIDHKKAAELERLQPGDQLILTKPLGIGVIGFAKRIGRVSDETVEAAERSMAELNRTASEIMLKNGATACTDITGFGLFGHLIRMAHKSQVTCRLRADNLPAFPEVEQLFEDEIIPGAIERNSEFVGGDLIIGAGVNPNKIFLGFDAQTSGGLLIAIPAEKKENLSRELQEAGVGAWHIGEITESSEGYIELV